MTHDYYADTDSAHLLVVDDEWAVREVIHEAIKNTGFACSKAGNGEETLEILEKEDIDVVITDIRMPGLSGLELLKTIKGNYDTDVILITGYGADYTYDEVIRRGASDFILKPLNLKELIVRIRRVLRERRLLAERNRIFKELEDAHNKLQDAYLDTINRLVVAAECKNEEPGGHLFRMSRYCELIAEKIGLPHQDIRCIKYASPMHDIGKIGIPDDILFKPGKLTEVEYNIMKEHTSIGASILAGSDVHILRLGREIAIWHHEKWNGQGYPCGLSGETIPLASRIVGIADFFDALTTERPYKGPYPAEVVYKMIRNERGKHFDPDLVDLVLTHYDEILQIREDVGPVQPDNDEIDWSERDIGEAVDVRFG